MIIYRVNLLHTAVKLRTCLCWDQLFCPLQSDCPLLEVIYTECVCPMTALCREVYPLLECPLLDISL